MIAIIWHKRGSAANAIGGIAVEVVAQNIIRWTGAVVVRLGRYRI